MAGRKNTHDDVWRRIDQRGADECWPFIGAVNTYGYGQIQLNGRAELVHRMAYLLSKGPIAEGLLVCHSCDNPRCCNPSHLFLGTVAENAQDASRKGRLVGAPKLTVSQVREIRRLATTGLSYYELGRRFGVTGENVSFIVRRRTWKHVA